MKTMKHRALMILLGALLMAGSLAAQDLPPGFKAWQYSSLRLRLNPKNSVSFSELTALNTRPMSFQFLQVNGMYSRRLANRWNLDVGYARSWFKTSEEIRVFQRVLVEIDFKQRWGEFRMKHSFRAEYHWPQLRKWQSRFIYSNKIAYRFKELPLRPTPYLRNQLYWYQGGRDVSYFEEETGELLERRPANGIHRYRMTAGVRMRLAKRLYTSVFYTWQREFNMPGNEFRRLNVPNARGNTQAPFNQFHLIGWSLDYTLKLY